MRKSCVECGSYAINHHCHGRDGSDDHLCDVCYWRKRASIAPELLQAAKDFVEWFECERIGDMPKAELHYARDAIAKTQGGKE